VGVELYDTTKVLGVEQNFKGDISNRLIGFIDIAPGVGVCLYVLPECYLFGSSSSSSHSPTTTSLSHGVLIVIN